MEENKMIKKVEIEYIVKPEPPTLEEKMEHYFESGLLLRICFGPPDSHILIQCIRGAICAVILWFLIFQFLWLLSLATDMII